MNNLLLRIIDYPSIIEETIKLQEGLTKEDLDSMQWQKIILSEQLIHSTNLEVLQSMKKLHCVDARINNTKKLVGRALTFDYFNQVERELFMLETINQNYWLETLKLNGVWTLLMNEVIRNAVRDKIQILAWNCTVSSKDFYMKYLERNPHLVYEYSSSSFEVFLDK